MKKVLKAVFALAWVPILLTGCIYAENTVTVHSDGSGNVKLVGGYSKEILNKLGKTPQDFSSHSNKYYEFASGGKKYLGETWEDAFRGPDDMNDSGVGVISQEIGPVSLVPVKGGFNLELKLWDSVSKDMKYEHKFPEFKNLSDKTLQGMTLRDLIAQDVKGLSLKAIFNMPYDVKQIAGGSTGVTVKGKSIHLDYLKMIKSGGREWKFESLKNGGKFSFSDVKSNSWYSKAVNAVSEGGMFSGFSDGTFKPDKAMSLAELFKVIAIGSGELNSNHPVYWAAGYVAFAKANGLVLSDVEETSEYWDTPATREQAVYALAVAANNLDKKEVNDTIKSDSIKDWNSIDSRMREMIRFAYNAGIVRGNEDGTFNPKSKITRAEISQILYNINWTKPKK